MVASEGRPNGGRLLLSERSMQLRRGMVRGGASDGAGEASAHRRQKHHREGEQLLADPADGTEKCGGGGAGDDELIITVGRL